MGRADWFPGALPARIEVGAQLARCAVAEAPTFLTHEGIRATRKQEYPPEPVLSAKVTDAVARQRSGRQFRIAFQHLLLKMRLLSALPQFGRVHDAIA